MPAERENECSAKGGKHLNDNLNNHQEHSSR